MDCNVKSVEKMIDVEVEMTRDAVQECQRGSCLMEGTGGGMGIGPVWLGVTSVVVEEMLQEE